MTGDFEIKVKEIKGFFENNDIIPKSNAFAVDLGSGHGIQAAALSALGFNVTAVDFSEQLLNELKQNLAGKVKTISADITRYQFSPLNKPELIICMGDTLTHLADIDEVKRLIENAAGSLITGGKLIVSYRDLSSELTGTSRFIPVKSDDKRILTCFLEFHEEYVNVNDILNEKIENKWKMKVSSYPKLRLPKESVYDILKECNMHIIVITDIAGMHYIISQKQK